MVPFPPFADRPVTPKIGKGSNYGPRKRTGNTVWHTMVGNLSSTDSWFRHRDCKSLTPWGIGGKLDGRLDGVIYRFMDYGKAGNIVPWSSGPWVAPGVWEGQAYVNEWGVNGINGFAEAIELSGLVATPLSAKQWTSLIHLTAAILHAGGREADEQLWRMLHREFCFYSGKDCPFPRVYNHLKTATAALVSLMRHYEGAAEQPQTHTIAGLKIVLPFKADAPIITPPAAVIFQDFEPDRVFTVGKGGATVRQWGERSAKTVTTLRAGEKVLTAGFYHGENVNGEDRWLVQATDPRGRIHASGFLESVSA